MQQFDQAPVEADAIESSLATIVQGSTAPSAFSVGKYIYLKHNGTLDPGLYMVKSAIAQGDTLSSSNLEQDSEGVVNALNGKFTTVTDLSSSISNVHSGLSLFSGRLYKNGRTCLLSAILLAGSSNVTISAYETILKMDASVKANENTDFIALIDGAYPVRPYVTKYLDSSKAYITTTNAITVPANKAMLLYATWFSAE